MRLVFGNTAVTLLEVLNSTLNSRTEDLGDMGPFHKNKQAATSFPSCQTHHSSQSLSSKTIATDALRAQGQTRDTHGGVEAARARRLSSVSLLTHLNFVGENDRHDHAVNRGGFAEDDANQVLRPDARRLHRRSHYAGAREEDAPPSAQHGQAQSKGDAHVCPAVRRHVGEHFGPPCVAVVIRAEHVFWYGARHLPSVRACLPP